MRVYTCVEMDDGPYRRRPPGPAAATHGAHGEHPGFVSVVACTGFATVLADATSGAPLGLATVLGVAMLGLVVCTARPR